MSLADLTKTDEQLANETIQKGQRLKNANDRQKTTRYGLYLYTHAKNDREKADCKKYYDEWEAGYAEKRAARRALERNETSEIKNNGAVPKKIFECAQKHYPAIPAHQKTKQAEQAREVEPLRKYLMDHFSTLCERVAELRRLNPRTKQASAMRILGENRTAIYRVWMK